eukprot:SAG11_NODE_26_length_23420_cov_40.459886_17_plen_184_part_00
MGWDYCCWRLRRHRRADGLDPPPRHRCRGVARAATALYDDTPAMLAPSERDILRVGPGGWPMQEDDTTRSLPAVPHAAAPQVAPAPPISVAVDWSVVLRTVKTSSQIETDVMPFLSRSANGGDFNGYYNSLQNLGAEYMRFSPWFGYPQVVVPELVQTKCQGSQANYTLMDGIMRDLYDWRVW